jgi:hypothetical protein
MRYWVLFFFLFILKCNGTCQHKVSFLASDSLRVTADLYMNDYSFPFILLFHQDRYSRGEYAEIADKLLNLDYNCLAVDLRSGGKLIDSRKDVKAAIDYAGNINNKPVILFGSSFSASLCMLEGLNNEKVRAVIAFSPGEYFEPEISVKNEIKKFNKSLFVSSSDNEYPYIMKMLENIPDSIKTIYRHGGGNDIHGAEILWESNKGSRECWLELLMFFRKLK